MGQSTNADIWFGFHLDDEDECDDWEEEYAKRYTSLDATSYGLLVIVVTFQNTLFSPACGSHLLSVPSHVSMSPSCGISEDTFLPQIFVPISSSSAEDKYGPGLLLDTFLFLPSVWIVTSNHPFLHMLLRLADCCSLYLGYHCKRSTLTFGCKTGIFFRSPIAKGSGRRFMQ